MVYIYKKICTKISNNIKKYNKFNLLNIYFFNLLYLKNEDFR